MRLIDCFKKKIKVFVLSMFFCCCWFFVLFQYVCLILLDVDTIFVREITAAEFPVIAVNTYDTMKISIFLKLHIEFYNYTECFYKNVQYKF